MDQVSKEINGCLCGTAGKVLHSSFSTCSIFFPFFLSCCILTCAVFIRHYLMPDNLVKTCLKTYCWNSLVTQVGKTAIWRSTGEKDWEFSYPWSTRGGTWELSCWELCVMLAKSLKHMFSFLSLWNSLSLFCASEKYFRKKKFFLGGYCLNALYSILQVEVLHLKF